jgi:hypothetical protein
MPKVPINYNNTIIYKIVCNDLSISNNYVGHTTNFVERKRAHKNSCINERNQSYNYKIYKTIRENMGWENWSMIEIEKYPCKDVFEACARERYYYEQLNSTLNMNFPQRNVKEYREIHKEKASEYGKEYYIANKGIIISKAHIYANSHKDEISQQGKLYRVSNKEEIKGRRSKRILCDCGKEINYAHKSRHLKSKVHNDLILCKDVISP